MRIKEISRRLTLCALTVMVAGLSGCTAQAETARIETTKVETARTDVSQVKLVKTPDGGIQPQSALDSAGAMHLIYFKGKPMAGDLFYVRSSDGGSTLSTPIRINSHPNSAIATGTIRGAQIAIGKDDRVHVAWNGSGEALPKGPGGNPMLYTRLNAEGTAFEPQRNLITWAGGLDGGGTLAADAKGHVYVAWHADPQKAGEAERAIYLARSVDNGQKFEREKRVNPEPTGACGCCQMRAFVNDKGDLSILYRAAGEEIHRDSILLTSRDNADSFQSANIDKWAVGMCPMSSYSMSQNKTNLLAAWETKEQVYMAVLPPAIEKPTAIAAPGSAKKRKHPVVLSNTAGEVLFAWTEGTGWNKGGALAWQVYDASGQPTDQKGRADGVPVWSLLSATTHPNGGFVLFY